MVLQKMIFSVGFYFVLQGTLEQLKKDLANAEEGKLLKDAEEERELTEL